MTAREQLTNAAPAYVAELEGEKARRFKARNMLIPSPIQVRDAIQAIEFGQSISLKNLREQLASQSGADITCPYTAGVCWRIVAEAAEEDRIEGLLPIAPWWRVTKDGKPNPKLPGGAESHRLHLLSEGIEI